MCLVKFLVEHGAKLDAKSKAGFTPLDIALGKDSFGPCRFRTTARSRCCEPRRRRRYTRDEMAFKRTY